MSQILSYLQAREEAMTRAIEELVALESPNDERAAVNAVGEYLVQAFGQLDADVERLPQAAFGDHLRVTWGQGNRQILLLGHMDTVWPIGELKERPFHVAQERDSGILKGTGPGIFDMKGGLSRRLDRRRGGLLRFAAGRPVPPDFIDNPVGGAADLLGGEINVDRHAGNCGHDSQQQQATQFLFHLILQGLSEVCSSQLYPPASQNQCPARSMRLSLLTISWKEMVGDETMMSMRGGSQPPSTR